MIANETMSALWAKCVTRKGNATLACVMIKTVRRRDVVKTIDVLEEKIAMRRTARHPTNATTTCASKTKHHKSAKFTVIVRALTNALSSMAEALV